MVDLEDCWPMAELKVNILLIQTQQTEQWHLLNYLTGFISSKHWVQRLYIVKFEFWFDNWRFTFKRQRPNFQTDSRLVGRQSFVRSTSLVFCKSVYQLDSVFHFSSRLVDRFCEIKKHAIFFTSCLCHIRDKKLCNNCQTTRGAFAWKQKFVHLVHHALFVALMQCTIFESPHSSELCADQMKFAWNGLSYLVDEREQFPAVSFSKTSLDFRATRRDPNFFDMIVSKGEKYVAHAMWMQGHGHADYPPPPVFGVWWKQLLFLAVTPYLKSTLWN